MTGEQLKEMFEGLIDDSIDETVAYQIMNDAKDDVEDERDWEMLKALNSTLSSSVGDTYLTAKTLPTDFKRVLTIFLGTSTTPLAEIPMSKVSAYANISGYFYINYSTNKLYICGTPSETKTIYLTYLILTDDLDAAEIPVWPERYHKIIPYKMASMFFAIDAGEKGRAWDDRWEMNFQRRLNKMKHWDDLIKIKGIENDTRGSSAEAQLQIRELD